MSSRPPSAPQPRAPSLYLVTPVIEDADRFAPELAAVLKAADIAAVLLRLADGGENAFIKSGKRLLSLIQDRNAAALLDGHESLVGRCGADGAHLTGIAAFVQALETLKPDRIAGIGGVTTKHDVMVAAEAGADYVLFGGPGENGKPASLADTIERVGWWAEIFETPCVALAEAESEVAPLQAAGADFIAIGAWVWRDPRGAAEAIASISRSLTMEAAG